VGLNQGLLQFLEFCGHHDFVSRLAALLVAVIGALDVSTNGDDTMWSKHLQNHVGIVRNCHELGDCRPSQEGVVR
jgi:hypothetical protein